MPSFTLVLPLLLASQGLVVVAKEDSQRRLVREEIQADGTVKSVNVHRQEASSQAQMIVTSSGETQPQMAKGVQSMLHEVEEMARSGTSPEPSKLKQIQNIVNDELLTALKATRDETEGDAKSNVAAIALCNTESTSRLSGIKTTTEVSVGKARTDHSTCREAEKGKHSSKNSACEELDNFLSGVNVPAEVPTGRPRDEMVQYVKTMSTYFCPKGPEATKLDDACTAASNEHAAHKDCYDKAKAAYEAFLVTGKELVKKYKVEYAALKKILCYVDVWLSDNDESTASKDVLGKCNSATVDTSPMDIDWPATPEKAACDISAVDKYPGTPGFVTTEYASFSDYVVAVIACLPPPKKESSGLMIGS